MEELFITGVVLFGAFLLFFPNELRRQADAPIKKRLAEFAKQYDLRLDVEHSMYMMRGRIDIFDVDFRYSIEINKPPYRPRLALNLKTEPFAYAFEIVSESSLYRYSLTKMKGAHKKSITTNWISLSTNKEAQARINRAIAPLLESLPENIRLRFSDATLSLESSIENEQSTINDAEALLKKGKDLMQIIQLHAKETYTPYR